MKKRATPDSSRKSVIHEAAARLEAHVHKYQQYMDRDRDIILLHLLTLLEQMSGVK